jgi:hypothetical protein
LEKLVVDGTRPTVQKRPSNKSLITMECKDGAVDAGWPNQLIGFQQKDMTDMAKVVVVLNGEVDLH